jgi:hypothetical protein
MIYTSRGSPDVIKSPLKLLIYLRSLSGKKTKKKKQKKRSKNFHTRTAQQSTPNKAMPGLRKKHDKMYAAFFHRRRSPTTLF